MKKSLLILFLSLAINQTLLMSSGKPLSIFLENGVEIKLPTISQIESDWMQDFAKLDSLLIKKRRISDHLDGKKGFSYYEKAYWVSFYGKSNNMKSLIKNSPKMSAYYQIYYLQAIILRANIEVKKSLDQLLQKTIQEIFPTKSDYTHINTLRFASCYTYLETELNDLFINLDHPNSKKVFIQYYIETTDKNKDQILAQYQNYILLNIRLAVKDLQNFLDLKERLTKEGINNNTNRTIIESEKKKRERVAHFLNQNDLYLAMIIRTNNRELLSRTIVEKETFNVDLKKRFPVAKNLKI